MNDDATFERYEMIIQPDGTLVLRGITEVAGGDIRNLPAFDEFAAQFAGAAPGLDYVAFFGGFWIGVGVVLLGAAWAVRRAWGKGVQL